MGTILETQRIIRLDISGKMAFPVGYEVLEKHFGSSPGWDSAIFWFYDRPVYYASEFNRILRAGEPYEIFRISWTGVHRVPRYEPARWHFHVYPVKRELKKAARTALEGCFGNLTEFMARAPVHDTYANRSTALFDPVEKSCRTERLFEI